MNAVSGALPSALTGPQTTPSTNKAHGHKRTHDFSILIKRFDTNFPPTVCMLVLGRSLFLYNNSFISNVRGKICVETLSVVVGDIDWLIRTKNPHVIRIKIGLPNVSRIESTVIIV